ncbi:MAG: flagellar assembly protein FliH [Actinomycetota bacterium]|jgi:flagellar assembly protein FliH|nr:flagellar assembly protein FliH [Actinomycetota bacterium]
MMTSSPDQQRTVVLRGPQTDRARPARIFSDLRTSPFVGRFGVDPRLVDPTLEAVVADAEEQARTAGWEQGRQEGREMARLEAADHLAAAEHHRQQELARGMNALAVSVAALDARQAPVFQDVESAVARMAVTIAEVLIGRHLELGSWQALDAVQRALALAPRQSEAIVRIHPDSAQGLIDLSGAMPGGSVTVVPDSSVEIGGCIVEAGNRTIDAQLGPALERLREVLS